MAKGEGVRPADLCADWGTENPSWHADPAGWRFSDVAQSFLSQRVAMHLRAAGVRPKDISRSCGGSQTGWRSKLNGNRLLSLADLLTLAATVDPTILNLLPAANQSPHDWVPAPYARFVRRNTSGEIVLMRPDLDDVLLAADLEDWYQVELNAGRLDALTQDVVTHRVLQAASSHGLASRAAILTRRESVTTVEWLDPRVRIDVLAGLETNTIQNARHALATLGDAIWKLATTSVADTSLLVATVPDALMRPVVEALGSGVGPTGQRTLSLTAASRFGIETSTLPDVHLRLLELTRGLLAISVKA